MLVEANSIDVDEDDSRRHRSLPLDFTNTHERLHSAVLVGRLKLEKTHSLGLTFP